MVDDDAYNKPTLPTVPANCGPPTISLSVLLDFAVQQIFHEVTVLSELLPKKLDADRKISLVQFSHSTRMLFVKLLALVKWVKSSKKFESCSSICFLLDQQAQYFVETADRLVTLSREELVLARLPSFQVPSSVDVLTQGTFSRLPLCIKERFIKDKKISMKDQANILLRLNQVLQYRVSRVAAHLSPRIQTVRIKNGIVTLTVPGEFEAQVTVLGETENTKWTLLNIKMLVEDYEIGYGTQLAHPLQLHMMHNVLQSRMDVSKNALKEVYSFLHSFAQSLQLDVLFCQCSQLAGRLRENLIIEKYDMKERALTIGYWVQRIAQRKGSAHVRLVPQYRFTIKGDATGDSALRVRHFPSAPNLGQLDSRSGRLSIDRLLSETLAIRCRERLLRIRKRLEAAEPKAKIALTGQATPCLSFPLLRDSVDNPQECLKISVNMFTGRVLCNLSVLESTNRAELRELEKELYDGRSIDIVRKQLDRLKVLLMIERYRRSVSALQVRILNEAQMAPFFSKVRSLPKDRICLQFVKEEQYYLVVTFTANSNLSVEMGLYLISAGEDKIQLLQLDQDLPNLFAPLNRVIGIESNTYGCPTELDSWMPKAKRRRVENSMERQLTHAVAAVDDRLSFMRLCLELDKKNIRYRTVEEEAHVGGLVLHITELSQVLDRKCPDFFRNLVRCCLRLDNRSRVQWPFECCMINAPLVRDVNKDFVSNKVCTWVQDLASAGVGGNESIAHAILERLTRYLHIYEIVHKFAKAYDAHYNQFCSVVAYTYHKLVLAYGENRDQLLVVYFQPRSGPHDRFKLTFGQTLPRPSVSDSSKVFGDVDTRWNTHCLMATILGNKFNKDGNLVDLVHYLVATSEPLHALANFSRIRFQSCKVIAQLFNVDISYPLKLKCHLVAINEHTVRLTFGLIHLEIALLEGDQVAVRDSSRGRPRAAGIHQFFMALSGGSARAVTDGSRRSDLSPMRQSNQLAAPSLQYGNSPSGQNMNLLAAHGQTERDGGSPMTQGGRSSLPATNVPVIVPHQALTKACTYAQSDGLLRSPLEDYLFGLYFLQRLNAAFDIYRRSSSPNMLGGYQVIRELSSNCDYVRVVITSVHPQGANLPAHVPSNITFYFHIDPNAFSLKLKITYASEMSPPESDVAVLEAYFEQVVCPLNNELAVMSFIQLCRLTPHGAISSIANIMKLQMEPPLFSQWAMNIQLVYLARENNSSSRRFCCGVITEPQNNANAMILIAFRPLKTSNERSNEKHIVKLFYSLVNNMVKQQGTEEEGTASILAACSQEAARTGECPLWPAVRQLMDRMSSGNVAAMPGSVSMPSSVTLVPPGSVGPVSVPPIGSIGAPVSVGNMGSVGHNPGSMVNPGSNTGL